METDDAWARIRLLHFCRTGDMKRLKPILSQHNSIDIDNVYGKYKRTPLLIAAYNGHSSIVKFLIENGSTIEATDLQGNNVFLIAAKNKLRSIMSYLLPLQNIYFNANTTNVKKKNAYMYAAKNGDVNILKDMVTKSSYIPCNCLAKDDNDNNILIYAVYSGRVECVSYVLEKCPEDHRLEMVKNINTEYETALSIACSNGFVDIVMLLINSNSDKYHQNLNNKSILIKGAEKFHNYLCIYIVHNYPDILNLYTIDNECILHICIITSNWDLLEFLLTDKDKDIVKYIIKLLYVDSNRYYGTPIQLLSKTHPGSKYIDIMYKLTDEVKNINKESFATIVRKHLMTQRLQTQEIIRTDESVCYELSGKMWKCISYTNYVFSDDLGIQSKGIHDLKFLIKWFATSLPKSPCDPYSNVIIPINNLYKIVKRAIKLRIYVPPKLIVYVFEKKYG